MNALTRQPIFDVVRAMLGRGFSPSEVKRLDAAIDEAEGGSDPFTRALDIVLSHEGGYANHPQDPGGRTNLGVTQRVWEQWTGKPATEAEMRSLTRELVAPLYRKNYWEAVRGDALPAAVALCAFDFAVNAGPSRAIRTLQRAAGVPEDGKLGPVTLAAVNNWGAATLAKRFQEQRRAFYRSLPTFPTFGKGWLRRVDEVEKAALELVA